MEYSSSETIECIPASVYHALNAYSRAVEKYQWTALPPAYIRFEGRVVAGDLHSLVAKLVEAAGWSMSAAPSLGYEFVVQSISLCEGEWKVKAEAEIQVPAADDTIFFWRLPTTLQLGGTGSECRVNAATYHTTHRQIERIVPWQKPRFNVLEDLRCALHSDRHAPPRAEWLRLRWTLLPPVITLAVDGSAVGACERQVLKWAVSQAIERWNRVLQGCHHLLWLEGVRRTHILIEAIHQPTAGGTCGACYYHVNSSRGSLRTYAARAETLIRILTAASADPTPLPLDPEEVRYAVEHELGHALGLADTRNRGSLMGGVGWAAAFPASGAVEAASIRRRRLLGERYSALARARWSLADEVLGAGSNRKGSMQVEEVGRICRNSLSIGSVVAESRWIAAIWEGERLLRKHDLRRAIAAFDEAAACAPDPSEATLRLHLAIALGAPQPQRSMVALETALRSGRRGWHITDRVHLHNSLAFGYRRLGDPVNSDRHRACAEWLSALRKVRWTYQWGVEYRPPHFFKYIAGDCLYVIRSGIRLFRSLACRLLK